MMMMILVMVMVMVMMMVVAVGGGGSGGASGGDAANPAPKIVGVCSQTQDPPMVLYWVFNRNNCSDDDDHYHHDHDHDVDDDDCHDDHDHDDYHDDDDADDDDDGDEDDGDDVGGDAANQAFKTYRGPSISDAFLRCPQVPLGTQCLWQQQRLCPITFLQTPCNVLNWQSLDAIGIMPDLRRQRESGVEN